MSYASPGSSRLHMSTIVQSWSGVMRDHSSGGCLKRASHISAAVGGLRPTTPHSDAHSASNFSSLLESPLFQPHVRHNLLYHRLRELAVHLGVGQQEAVSGTNGGKVASGGGSSVVTKCTGVKLEGFEQSFVAQWHSTKRPRALRTRGTM